MFNSGSDEHDSPGVVLVTPQPKKDWMHDIYSVGTESDPSDLGTTICILASENECIEKFVWKVIVTTLETMSIFYQLRDMSRTTGHVFHSVHKPVKLEAWFICD